MYYVIRITKQKRNDKGNLLCAEGLSALPHNIYRKKERTKEMARLNFQKKETNKLPLQEVYLLDNYLSYRSKGLLGILYMLNRNLDFNIRDFADMSTDSYGGVKASFKELETLGYISKKMLRDKHGRFITMEYTIHSHPRKRSIGGGIHCQ